MKQEFYGVAQRLGRWALASLMTSFLVACGGGGGSPGECLFCSGGPTDGASYAVTVTLQRSGAATTSIKSAETVQAVAKVIDASGAAVSGAVVTFVEDGAGLLQLAPSSGTALADSTGLATIDVAASDVTVTGATTLTAQVSLGGTAYSGSVAFEIKAGTSTDVAEPAAVNFVSVSPADTAIVIKGAGGNGRTESATLTFKVVDANNTPIQGATVNFTASPSNAVTLNVSSAVSDSSGQVVTTVQSKTIATSVVIRAESATNSAVYGMSDTLVISTGAAVAGGFEIVAEKYNLDGRFTGDSTEVTAFVRDANGNPVADGVAVSFTTDYGVIGSSQRGACTTSDGTCTVTFKVQNPRGTGLATVIGQVTLPSDVVLSESMNINMASSVSTPIALDTAGDPATDFVIPAGTCSSTQTFTLDDGTGRSAAAGTVIAVDAVTSKVTANVTSGTPVLDSLGFAPTSFTVEVDASSEDLLPLCVANGPNRTTGFVTLSFTSPNGVKFGQRLTLSYPSN